MEEGKNTMEENDHENPKTLILLAKEGDKAAFEKLYALYYTPIFRYLYIRAKNKREAEDLVQTVFLKVYTSLSKFELGTADPLAFFFTVARNSLIDSKRKEKHGPVYNDELVFINQEAFEDSDSIAGKENRDLLQNALAELTEEQQEIIILKFIEDKSNKDIVRITGKTEEAIRQIQFRAIKKIRETFKQKGII